MRRDDDRDRPSPREGTPAGDDEGPVARVWNARSGPLALLREALLSAAVVAVIGLLLFGISGVWPPMVAVESQSMEPHMYRGDLIVISEPGRYVPGESTQTDTGVVTADAAAEIDYRTFGGPGSVVVYRPDGRGGTPVIHRAHLWVEDGENWYDRANPAYVGAGSCAELRNCPAPHAGFITKGDNNGGYDQVIGITSPVRPSWVIGVAHVRVPWLGHIRLWLSAGATTGLGGTGNATTGGAGVVVGPGAAVA
jgi:signal peptidase